MRIGMPKEIKENEFRVAIVPHNVSKLTSVGHQVYVETDAGLAAGFSDEQYVNAGAEIVPDEKTVFEKSDLIVKVKEILPSEFEFLEERHILCTYIHSANRLPQTRALLDSKVVAFAYEDVKDKNGGSPLLEPMSRLAGETGLLTGLFYSFTTQGGTGKIVSGNPGINPMKIVIFGAGHVGIGAARFAKKLDADVVLMDVNIKQLDLVSSQIIPGIKTVFSTRDNIVNEIKDADLVINAVKWFPGLTLISRDMLKGMKKGALIVDIDAEPNGAIETCRYTTHENPVYEVDGIRHICIPNLPSSVANTASQSLSNATIPYIQEIADKGWVKAALDNEKLIHGLDFIKGNLTFKDTAEAFDIPMADKMELLEKYSVL